MHVANQLMVDLGEDGRVSLVARLDGVSRAWGTPVELAWPLDGKVLEDLRWYLEDYLGAPFGVYEDRGGKIEAALPGWGRAVFEAVFAVGPARDTHMKVRDGGPFELAFRSGSPAWLALPWELMVDPARGTPLALDIASVSRGLPGTDAAEEIPVPEGRLRVLMVISRPAGAGGIGYRMIARPLMSRLEAVRGQVDLVVLRPPTLAALRTEHLPQSHSADLVRVRGRNSEP